MEDKWDAPGACAGICVRAAIVLRSYADSAAASELPEERQRTAVLPGTRNTSRSEGRMRTPAAAAAAAEQAVGPLQPAAGWHSLAGALSVALLQACTPPAPLRSIHLGSTLQPYSTASVDKARARTHTHTHTHTQLLPDNGQRWECKQGRFNSHITGRQAASGAHLQVAGAAGRAWGRAGAGCPQGVPAQQTGLVSPAACAGAGQRAQMLADAAQFLLDCKGRQALKRAQQWSVEDAAQ